jgi:hypothetical protein
MDALLTHPRRPRLSAASFFVVVGLLVIIHRTIQENANLLTKEGKMIKDIQQKLMLHHVTDQDMDDYVETLASILDRKEDLIGALQDKVMAFRQNNQEQQ